MTTEFTVYGTPAGQGNLKTGKGGKLYHANDARLRVWRGLVRTAALGATLGHEYTAWGSRGGCAICGVPEAEHVALLGAVGLAVVITVPALKKPKPWPTTRSTSDWDHYARAIGDALTGVVYADDSQICDARLQVVYPGPRGLDRPGALIRAWPLETP